MDWHIWMLFFLLFGICCLCFFQFFFLFFFILGTSVWKMSSIYILCWRGVLEKLFHLIRVLDLYTVVFGLKLAKQRCKTGRTMVKKKMPSNWLVNHRMRNGQPRNVIVILFSSLTVFLSIETGQRKPYSYSFCMTLSRLRRW